MPARIQGPDASIFDPMIVRPWGRKWRVPACTLLCFLLPAALGDAQHQGELRKLAEGVYVHVAEPEGILVANAGVVLLSDGVLVFDTHFTREGGEELLRQIRGITRLPVRFVALSHFHPDHTHGIDAFPGAALVLATANARRDILEKDLPAVRRALDLGRAQLEQWSRELQRARDEALQSSLRAQIAGRRELVERLAGLQVRAPVMALDDRLTIRDRERTLEFLLPGAGHTDGDLILYLPREKIVFAGDLFFDRALPNTEDARILEWTETLAVLLDLDAEVFVPGHGRPCGRGQVEEFRDYLRDLRALVEPAVARGEPLPQVVREAQLPEKYGSYGFRNFFPANVQKMYAELMALQLAAPVQPAPEARKKKPPQEQRKP